MAILNLDETKAALGIAAESTEWDGVLNLLIASVQSGIETEIGCPLEQKVYVAKEIRGNDSSFLPLPAWPVEEITAVSDENGTNLIEGEDYDHDPHFGILTRLYGVWSKHQRYYVTFSAGYDFQNGEASDLKAVALELVAQQWKRYKDKSYGESGRTFPDGGVTYSDLNLTERQKKIIQNHKRYLI